MNLKNSFYDISYRTLIGLKLLQFDKVDGLIGVNDGTEYLILFGFEKYDDAMYNRIRYLIGLKVVLHMFFLTI